MTSHGEIAVLWVCSISRLLGGSRLQIWSHRMSVRRELDLPEERRTDKEDGFSDVGKTICK